MTRIWVCVVCLVCSVAQAQGRDAETQIVHLFVSGGEIVGENVIRISEGTRFALTWTTDTPLNIHLHGYDVELTLNPGNEARMNLTAYATGRFPITLHGSPGSHGHGARERTLAYLEVYPE